MDDQRRTTAAKVCKKRLREESLAPHRTGRLTKFDSISYASGESRDDTVLWAKTSLIQAAIYFFDCTAN